MKKSPFVRLVWGALSLLALVLPASATWSIVAVNMRTGEVAVASATCLTLTDLERFVPVILVGKGAAAAQSLGDMGGVNRQFIFNAFRNVNSDPQSILDSLSISDPSHQTRQYGIVSFAGGGPVTFTGSNAGAAASGVVGQSGDYVYAIQGNVLTDDLVVLAAETAFVNTNGDMGQRLMASMQAARALGGDGRCSCSTGSPTTCGAPPPSFTKSAHCGFIVVARMGNLDGSCNGLRGCATGTYYLNLNVRGSAASATSLDPVLKLQNRYDAWRAARVGSPDGVLSSVSGVDSIPADGVTQRSFTVQLVDLDGTPLTKGGALVSVRHLDPSVGIASLGAVQDNGDGSYSFSVTAGTSVGTDQLVVKADDGFLRPDLFPYLTLRSESPPALHQGFDSVSAAAGDASLPIQFNLPGLNTPSGLGRYLLMASLNGTSPGLHVGLGTLPLNKPLVFLQAGHPVQGLHDAALGNLDAQGRASETVLLDAGLLQQLAGRRIDFAALYMEDGGLKATNASGVQILP